MEGQPEPRRGEPARQRLLSPSRAGGAAGKGVEAPPIELGELGHRRAAKLRRIRERATWLLGQAEPPWTSNREITIRDLDRLI